MQTMQYLTKSAESNANAILRTFAVFMTPYYELVLDNLHFRQLTDTDVLSKVIMAAKTCSKIL